MDDSNQKKKQGTEEAGDKGKKLKVLAATLPVDFLQLQAQDEKVHGAEGARVSADEKPFEVVRRQEMEVGDLPETNVRYDELDLLFDFFEGKGAIIIMHRAHQTYFNFLNIRV